MEGRISRETRSSTEVSALASDATTVWGSLCLATVQRNWIEYIALPSPEKQTTGRSELARLAPTGFGKPARCEPAEPAPVPERPAAPGCGGTS